MNALVWLLIPVVVTCFAAWWLAQRAHAAERDDPHELSATELERMQRALEKPTGMNPNINGKNTRNITSKSNGEGPSQ